MTGAQFISFPIPGDQDRVGEVGLLRQLERQICMITHSETIAILDRLEAKGEAHMWADADHRLWGDITAKGRVVLGPSTAERLRKIADMLGDDMPIADFSKQRGDVRQLLMQAASELDQCPTPPPISLATLRAI